MEDIGIRLKKLREQHGLSQRQLARQSGVSNAMISLIEKGRSRPSLGLLKAVLDSLPISVSEFFTLEVQLPRKTFYRHDELTEIGDGPISYLQAGNNSHNQRLQLMLETYAPGADTGRSMLHHEAEEGGIVVAGRLEVTVDGETRELGPGDAYLFNSQLPHRFRNAGSEDCVLVTACTPPSF